jgi:hypothetical protein
VNPQGYEGPLGEGVNDINELLSKQRVRSRTWGDLNIKSVDDILYMY